MSSQQLYPNVTVGLDLGDKVSRTCEINAAGKIVKKAGVATTPGAIERYFGGRPRCRVALEVGTHSPWVSRQLKALGHEAVVANTSEIFSRHRRKRRNDKLDAEFLARQARADVELLHPIQHRGAEAQQDLALLRARDQLVQARTKLINHVRGAVKSLGSRLSKCDADVFAKRVAAQVPEPLRPALMPLVEVIGDLTRRIRAMDKQVEQMERKYPEAVHLQQPAGVGPLTALAYVLVVEDAKRFKHSRDVGPFLGLVPKLDDSSDLSPQLHITKAGDALVRRYLVSAARYILGPFGPDCDLRRYGQAISARGGKNADKRAVVGVARKLAVLLHQLWVSHAEYDPDWSLHQRQRAA
jgi:transposase